MIKKTAVYICLFVLGFTTGYFIARQKKDVLPSVSSRKTHLGLKKSYVDYGTRESQMVQLWFPYGITGYGSGTGEDFIYIQKEIPYIDDELLLVKSAIELLLRGPSEKEKQLGVYSLVPGGKIKDIGFKDGNLTINFSKEFSPGGGSLAQKQVRLAVEEVVRQFPSVESFTLLVEGGTEALEP